MPQLITQAQLRQLETSLLGRINLRPRSITEDKLAVGAVSAAIVREGSISDIHIGTLSVDVLDGGTISGEVITIDAGGQIQSGDYDPDVAGWAIFADGTAEFNNAIVRGDLLAGTININGAFTVSAIGDVVANNITATGVLTALAGSDVPGTYISDGDLSANLDLTTAGSISSPGFVSGAATGWAIDGLGNAEFNNATVRGTIAGGTIDIGGSDASSFHVDADGNVWSGAASRTAGGGAPFQITSVGSVRVWTLGVRDSATGDYKGGLTYSSGAMLIEGEQDLALGAGGTAVFQPAITLDESANVIDLNVGTGSVRITTGGNVSLGANQATNLQFFSGTGVRSGYVGYASNDDFRIWNEEAAGTILFATNDTTRMSISANGATTHGSSGTPQPIVHAFYNEWDGNPCMQVLNRQGVFTGSANGIYIYLGASGASANPGNDDDFMLFRRGDGTVCGSIDGNGSGGVRYNTTSDRTLKDDITADVAVGAAAFDKIPWRSFTWKATGDPGHGVIAQQLAKIPEWSHTVRRGGTRWERDPDTGKKVRQKLHWGVDYVPFIGAIGAKLADVDRRLRALENR